MYLVVQVGYFLDLSHLLVSLKHGNTLNGCGKQGSILWDIDKLFARIMSRQKLVLDVLSVIVKDMIFTFHPLSLIGILQRF